MSTFDKKTTEQHYYETQVSEEEYLNWYKQQHFPTQDMPSVTVDNVIFCYNKEQDALKVLLIKRSTHPFKNSWALPGGFVIPGEATADSCIRETKEETNVTITREHVEQLHTFSTPGRDPRGWVITVSYLAFIGEEPLDAGDEAAKASWFDLTREGNLLYLTNHLDANICVNLDTGESIGEDSLAFDHAKIIIKAFNRVCNKMYHEPQVLRVLGKDFTISEARKVYAKFLGVNFKDIDHSNFKKAMLPYFTEIGERATGVGRPSKIYELKS
ncbi:NUDIX domain-containing protein [Vagococcus bubulae]|uniref:DNA mismatch repair protein MutT n=1 Tax=Vagococcus bubulae TaxID=1977868 RepID=A0A429ZEW7_9ENTE|nr:NUDIX domain-containing protein [Vagococcus bubulae]RST92217.1 DNA mismatch repair protein MutT [Vagococcus bubulae]